MPRFLMSYPEFFDVKYSINSWMDVKNRPDNLLARKQWRKLNQYLQLLGADVDVMNGDKNLPDMVFTANAGTVKDKIFIPSNFRYKERQGESALFERWFADNGFEIRYLPSGYYQEGHGDILQLDDFYVAGYGFRSSYESHEILSEILNTTIVPLELVNGYFYHLDTCFCSFKNPKNNASSFIYYEEAFSLESVSKLKNLPYDKFAVPKHEAELFVCNSVQVNDSVILSEGCNETANWLRTMGYKVIFHDMSQFHLAGGSSKCSVIQLS